MTAVQTAPDLSTKKAAIHSLREIAGEVFERELDRPIEVQRLSQIALAERNYLYFQGKQYLVPAPDIKGRTIGWRQVGKTGKGKDPRFASIYNHIYGDGIKFMAIIGQQLAKLKAVPDDPGNTEFRRMAETGDMAIELLHRWWNIQRLQRQIAFHNWVTGPAFLHPRYVSDGYQYGWVEELTFTTETMEEPAGFRCQNCQEKSPTQLCQKCANPIDPAFFEPASRITLPVEGPPERYARGRVEMNICSSLFVTIPFGKDEMRKLEWLAWRQVMPKYVLKGRYKQFADEGTSSTIDQATTDATEGIESPSGIDGRGQSEKSVYEERWITPQVYQAFPLATRRALQKQFPDGMMIARAGDQILDVEASKLIDNWSACVTGTGEYLESAPLAHYLISMQDDTNSLFNMGKEIVLRHIPRALIDSSLIDREAWNEKPPTVGELLLTRIGGNQNLGAMVKDLPRADFPPELIQLEAVIAAQRQYIGGVQPVLAGGGDQTFTTWRASAQAKNMAMMQLTPVVLNTHDGIGEATMNGVRQLVKYGTGEEMIPPKKGIAFAQARVLRLEELSETGWHIERIENLPMSYGEKVQRVQELAEQNPPLSMTIGLHHPMNTKAVQEMLGVDDLYCPGSHEQEAAEALIEKLLLEQPGDDIDPMTGGPIRKSSQPVRPFEHKNHGAFAEIIRTWCNSSIGREMNLSNPLGYENVALHGQEQEQMAAAMMAPAPAAEGGPQPGGAPPAGGDSPLAPVQTASTGPIPPVEEGLE